MIYIVIADPGNISAANGQQYPIFSDSTNDDAFSTKLPDGTVVELFMLMNGFFASGETEDLEYVIQSELVTDEGLLIAFTNITEGDTHYLGSFYGTASKFSANYGMYFGLDVSGKPIIMSTSGGASNQIYMMPDPAGTQAMVFVLAGGQDEENKIDFIANNIDDITQIIFTSASGETLRIEHDENATENYFNFSNVSYTYLNAKNGAIAIVTEEAGIEIDSFTSVDITAADQMTLAFTTLAMIGLDLYADNAAAVTGGLTPGQFYLNSTSYALTIVHA